VGTLETRVLVTARKFKELDSSAALQTVTLESGGSVDQKTRALQAPELETTKEV
jgi:hypothetical protein